MSGLIKMGCGTAGTASSVLFCIALRCFPNPSLKARLICPIMALGSKYSAGVFGVLLLSPNYIM